ncbi:MAG: glycosyltransferase [Deltaproteobacteria bacterium]|nr:glycosyltransferase [Deltaproteobacteria bacterium]
MKILDVTEFYSERGGGVRSHLALKSHVLCQLGHEHVVVAPGPPGRPDGAVEANPESGRLARAEAKARVIRVEGPASPYDPTYHLLLRFDKIAAIVERERPDVLEVHSPYLAALGAMRASPAHYGVRTFQWHSDFIDTYGGVLEAHLERKASPLLSSLGGLVRPAVRPAWALVRAIASRCDATLVAAEWQVAKLVSHGVPRVVRVPFGIERETFRAEARSVEARRELLTLAGDDAGDEHTPILIGIGRFAIEKRWDVVIDAFLRLRDRHPRHGRAVLVLVGDGPEKERMKARVAGRSDVVFAGFVKDRAALARTLASADALVHGCPFETFGLSIAEAMSCGLPAVVPDEGGAAEMHVDGSGERYRALDVDACVEAIARLLDRVRRDPELVRRATTQAVARLPNVREQFESQVTLYRDLLGSRAP